MKKNQFVICRKEAKKGAYLDPIQDRWSERIRPIKDEFEFIRDNLYRDFLKKRKPIDEKYSKLTELIYL